MTIFISKHLCQSAWLKSNERLSSTPIMTRLIFDKPFCPWWCRLVINYMIYLFSFFWLEGQEIEMQVNVYSFFIRSFNPWNVMHLFRANLILDLVHLIHQPHKPFVVLTHDIQYSWEVCMVDLKFFNFKIIYQARGKILNVNVLNQ
jgi:hypothetical protein